MRFWQPVKVSILPLLVQSQVSKAVRRTGYNKLWCSEPSWWAALVSSQLPSKGTVLQTAAFADSLPTHIFKTPYCISNKSVKLVKLLLVSSYTHNGDTLFAVFSTIENFFIFSGAIISAAISKKNKPSAVLTHKILSMSYNNPTAVHFGLYWATSLSIRYSSPRYTNLLSVSTRQYVTQ